MLFGAETHDAGDGAELGLQVRKFEIEWARTVLLSDEEAADFVLAAIEDGVEKSHAIVFEEMDVAQLWCADEVGRGAGRESHEGILTQLK